MNLLVDTVSRVLTHDPAPLIRGCTETVTIQFRKGTAPFRLADGCAVQVGLKDWDNPADDILCYAEATRPAADNAPYTTELSLNTVELLAKFTAGVKYLNCSLEVKWETVAGSDKFTKTRRTKCRVDADTIRDTDAAPSQLAGLAIPGAILQYAGSSLPSGWLLCYGQAISRVTYSALFTAIGTTFGVGNGTTTFNVPDLRGRVAAGKGDMGGSAAGRLGLVGQGNTLGGTGGVESFGPTTGTLGVTGGSDFPALISIANITTTQPTIILNYIIKT